MNCIKKSCTQNIKDCEERDDDCKKRMSCFIGGGHPSKCWSDVHFLDLSHAESQAVGCAEKNKCVIMDESMMIHIREDAIKDLKRRKAEHQNEAEEVGALRSKVAKRAKGGHKKEGRAKKHHGKGASKGEHKTELHAKKHKAKHGEKTKQHKPK